MIGSMLAVTLVCSDQACDHEVVEVVWSQDQVELMVCEGCGCCLQAVGYAEAVEVRPVIQSALSLAA
jgi:heterodisulfide reductase subunit A-like polyferredoxin